MTSATVWFPVLPPIEATMGISVARATSFSIEPSKIPMTLDATRAVSKFRKSHIQRLRALRNTGPNRSSSPFRPSR